MKKLYQIMELTDTKIGKTVDVILLIVIFINILTIIVSSFPEVNKNILIIFDYIETISIIIFTIEYILRIIVSKYRYKNKNYFQSVLIYIISPIAIIDLFSILPFYLPFIFTTDLRILRIFKILRLVRLFKLTRYSKSLSLFATVINSKKTEITLSVILLFFIQIILGTLIYYAENDIQPHYFRNIIDSIIWTIKTMIFLGYDEVKPLSDLGNFFGGIITLVGLGWITLPISILSSGFIEAISKENKKENIKCPNCGKTIV